MKIAYWIFCASKHKQKFQILTFGEILTFRFSNLNRIRTRILFGFGKSCEYEYEYYSGLENHPNTNTNIFGFKKSSFRIRIRIVFCLKMSAKYEHHYSVSTIQILFKYQIMRSPLLVNFADLFGQNFHLSKQSSSHSQCFPYLHLIWESGLECAKICFQS